MKVLEVPLLPRRNSGGNPLYCGLLRSTLLAASICLAGPVSLALQQSVPEAPSVWRDLAGVWDPGGVQPGPGPNPLGGQPVHTHAHMPAWRTTSDGRVGVRVEGTWQGGIKKVKLGLMKPEMLDTPLLTNGATQTDPTVSTMPTMSTQFLVGVTEPDGTEANLVELSGWKPTHACLWDDGEITAINGRDHYQVKIVVTSRAKPLSAGTPPAPGIRVTTTPVEIIVKNPKTKDAEIVSAIVSGRQTSSDVWEGPTPGDPGTPRAFKGYGFEPTVAYNGRLLVLRVSSPDFTWYEPLPGIPLTGVPHAGVPHDEEQYVDIAYAWSESPNDPANAANWNQVYPITFAPHDARLNDKVGFALEPFRDSKGNVIYDPSASSPVYDLGGSYPWIDRKGDNLFIETIYDTLAKRNPSDLPKLFLSSPTEGRYPYEEVPVLQGSDPLAIEGVENLNRHQGVSVLGKWTHGKLVQLDSLINDSDFALGNDGPPDSATESLGPQRRLVTLYQPNSIPANVTLPVWTSAFGKPNEGKVLLSYGRATANMPLGENKNSNIIDSIENKLNYRKHALTTSYRDVTWHLSVSRQTDQHAFDDSIDPDALIVANMTAALEIMPPLTGTEIKFPENKVHFRHMTGWSTLNQSFTDSIQIANAATALPSRWTLPTHGEVLGGGRIEPVAAGGIHGKGFWLDGQTRIEFSIPVQTGSEVLGDHDWYAGLFLDARFADDTTERRLLTFPDGSQVRLYGRRQVLFVDGNGKTVHRASIPAAQASSFALADLLPEGGWAHLALQVRNGGHDVELLLDGLPLSRWRSNLDPLFRMGPGTLVVGSDSAQSDGVTGWIDDFVLLAHTVDAETAANHAGGTLVGLPSNSTNEWNTDMASRFPTWAHEEISAALEARGETTSDVYANFIDYGVDHGSNAVTLQELLDDVSRSQRVRSGLQFPEGPLFHDAPRPFSGDNKFCLSCHSADGVQGLGLQALAYQPGLEAKDDVRRQPTQPPALIYGVIPAGLVDSTARPSPMPSQGLETPTAGSPIDVWMMEDWAGTATVANFTILDASNQEELMVLDGHAVGSSPGSIVLDPALLGTADVLLRVNLDSSQGDVTVQLSSARPPSQLSFPPVTLSAPYHFPIDLDSLLSSMTHTISATPQGGVTRKMVFTIPQAASPARTIATYREGFQDSSPAASWLYGWNAGGSVNQVGSFRALNWYPNGVRYTDFGLAYPEGMSELNWGSLHEGGGHPGKGSVNGASQDRFVMAGYRAKYAGEYSLRGTLGVLNAASNGVELGIFHQSGAVMTPIQPPAGTSSLSHAFGPFPSVSLAAGDILWVVVGPGGDATSDGFDLDFEVLFDESAF